MPDELAGLKSFYAQNMPTAKSIFKNTSPNWGKISSVKPDDLTVYEITLNNPDRVGLMSNTSKTKDPDKFEQTHALKLLLFVNEQGKVEKGCYMLIEASTAAELINVHYKRAGNLNGNVVYYNLNGAMSNGVAYVNGKAKRRISYLSESEIMAIKRGDDSRMTQGCSMFYIETGYMGCIYDYCTWYSTGYVGFPICGNGSGQHPENDVEEGFEGGVPNYENTNLPLRTVTNNTSDPCIKSGVNLGMQANTAIGIMLNKTFGTSNEYGGLDIEFTQGSTGTDAGWCRKNGNISWQITINQNLPNSSSREFILATVYHEILHAYLEASYPKDAAGMFLIPHDEHQDMADKYLVLMIGALKINYPELSDKDAWGLAWGGLEETKFYKSKLTENQRLEI